jgi:hypothetical protein
MAHPEGELKREGLRHVAEALIRGRTFGEKGVGHQQGSRLVKSAIQLQTSAQHGFRWWEVDLIWGMIRALSALGLAHRINLAPTATTHR